MDWLIPSLLYYCIAPMLLYYYYCRLCVTPFRWYWGIVYVAASFGLSVCESMSYMTGFLYILSEILLLTLAGVYLLKSKPAVTFAVSSLVISAFSIIEGIMQSFTFWIIANLKAEYAIVLKYADIGRHMAAIIILILIFKFIIKVFSGGTKGTHNFIFPALVVPILFIALVEKTVSSTIYGDTLIWDSAEGLIAPVVNNVELLILRLTAFVGLFSALIVYQKLTDSIRNEQTIQLLEQQTQDKEIYVREAQSRYEQTLSFRHDIKNHLLVLKQLLKEDKKYEASNYLTNLEQVSDSLSFPVNTGNPVVNALLGSKLAVAARQGIKIDYYVAIPQSSGINDIDWCIILSNALDNAINASGYVNTGEKFIHISGKKKGNFYLLVIENPCEEKTVLPTDGIGLSNIKAVAGKYGGKAEIEISDAIFKLSILLIISQQ